MVERNLLSKEDTLTARTRMILVGVLVVIIGSWSFPWRASADLVRHTGGAVKAYMVTTQDAPFTSTEATYTNLPGSALRLTVPAGTSDLLSLTFSAECRLIGGEGPTDWVGIRLVAIRDGVGSVVEPFDTGSPQAFCSTDLWETHAGTWVLQAGPGNYRFSVQVLTTATDSTLWIDDWTFQLVAYD